MENVEYRDEKGDTKPLTHGFFVHNFRKSQLKHATRLPFQDRGFDGGEKLLKLHFLVSVILSVINNPNVEAHLSAPIIVAWIQAVDISAAPYAGTDGLIVSRKLRPGYGEAVVLQD